MAHQKVLKIVEPYTRGWK